VKDLCDRFPLYADMKAVYRKQAKALGYEV
jgi:hypothetical protein